MGLWHRLQIGGEVLSNEGDPQVYGIISIISGRPSLCNEAQREMAKMSALAQEMDAGEPDEPMTLQNQLLLLWIQWQTSWGYPTYLRDQKVRRP